MQNITPVNNIDRSRLWARRSNRWSYRLADRWMLVFSAGFGLLVWLPFLAPALMDIGFEAPARAIYAVYSFLCHQLPQRSYFLFGDQFTYSLSAIQTAWQDTTEFNVLRQFIGTPTMGWKVAWSDRMVSMYTSILIFSWIWYPLRRKIKPLPFFGLVLLSLPMALDGFSHMISDFAGIGQGFRDSNLWLASMTNERFSASFYAGDAWGSINSIMRLITGILFGAGVVWFGFPYLDLFFTEFKHRIREKFQKAGIPL